MEIPNIRFVGPEYDGAESELGTLSGRLSRILKDEIAEQYGEENVASPSNIKIMPVVIEEDRFFMISAWLETEAPKGMAGVLQPFIGSFDIVANQSDAFLRNRDRIDGGTCHSLTTVETITLSNLGRLAAAYDAQFSPIARDGL